MKHSLVAVAAVALALCGAGKASATFNVSWGANSGLTDGDNMSISFTGFTAGQLTSITGLGYSHNHGTLAALFGIDIHLNGVWTTIKTWTQDTADHVLSERTLGGPITFAS